MFEHKLWNDSILKYEKVNLFVKSCNIDIKIWCRLLRNTIMSGLTNITEIFSLKLSKNKSLHLIEFRREKKVTVNDNLSDIEINGNRNIQSSSFSFIYILWKYPSTYQVKHVKTSSTVLFWMKYNIMHYI